MNFIRIDGGLLEGGGQILRNSATISSLLNKAIEVQNIRAGRDKPGLRPQHLTGLQLINNMCNGNLKGCEVGSTSIQFVPGKICEGRFVADTKTAGSVSLLVQAALPCLLYARGATELFLRGGTNADMAPQIDYLTLVFQPMARKLGVEFSCNILKRGYYPKGGGEVIIKSDPLKQLEAIELVDRGPILRIYGRAFVAGVLPVKVAQRMANEATNILRRTYSDIPISIEAVKEPDSVASGTGCGLIITAESATGCLLGGSALGRKGLSAEDVARVAAEELLSELSHSGCVDTHLQDQLIIFMALAKGKSRVKCGPISLHTQTAIHIATQLTEAKFNVEKIDTDVNIIECEGIGLENNLWSS